jgi:hypothetical protein
MPVHPTLPGWSSRSTVSLLPLLTPLALICSPLLNRSSQTLFLSSARSDRLAFLYQWASITGAFLGFLIIEHHWQAVSFRFA